MKKKKKTSEVRLRAKDWRVWLRCQPSASNILQHALTPRPVDCETTWVNRTRAWPRISTALRNRHPRAANKLSCCSPPNAGYKYHRILGILLDGKAECQGSIIYARKRKLSDPTMPTDRAAAYALCTETFQRRKPLISQDSTDMLKRKGKIC